MALYIIFTSCFKYWTEDTVHQLIIKKKNSKVIFPASISGGRAERMVPGVFQGREQRLSVNFTRRRTKL